MIGLHTVFEHHEAQGTPAVLAAFLHEYRIAFPVAIDAKNPTGALPQTMQAYGMHGTPTTLLVDRRGFLRLHKFGRLDDMRLGAAIASLIAETLMTAPFAELAEDTDSEGDRCRVGAEPCT